MGRQYCFGGTFQRIIGFLDTIRGFAIGRREKGDPDEPSIAGSLSYRQHIAYDPFGHTYRYLELGVRNSGSGGAKGREVRFYRVPRS